VRWVRLRGVVTAASPVRAPTPNESVLSQTGPFMHTALPARPGPAACGIVAQ
jgi:hypothetical protein